MADIIPDKYLGYYDHVSTPILFIIFFTNNTEFLKKKVLKLASKHRNFDYVPKSLKGGFIYGEVADIISGKYLGY